MNKFIAYEDYDIATLINVWINELKNHKFIEKIEDQERFKDFLSIEAEVLNLNYLNYLLYTFLNSLENKEDKINNKFNYFVNSISINEKAYKLKIRYINEFYKEKFDRWLL